MRQGPVPFHCDVLDVFGGLRMKGNPHRSEAWPSASMSLAGLPPNYKKLVLGMAGRLPGNARPLNMKRTRTLPPCRREECREQRSTRPGLYVLCKRSTINMILLQQPTAIGQRVVSFTHCHWHTISPPQVEAVPCCLPASTMLFAHIPCRV